MRLVDLYINMYIDIYTWRFPKKNCLVNVLMILDTVDGRIPANRLRGRM